MNWKVDCEIAVCAVAIIAGLLGFGGVLERIDDWLQKKKKGGV